MAVKKVSLRWQRMQALATLEPRAWEEAVRAALVRDRGVVAAAARRLGATPRTLWRVLKARPDLLQGTGHVPKPSLVDRMAGRTTRAATGS